MIKLVALDMDDTLLNKQAAISTRNAAAIRRAAAAGVTVTIATGRMFRSARPFAAGLGLDVPLITYNGALIRGAVSGETLLDRPVDAAVAAAVLALFQEKGWYIQTYVDDVLYVAEKNAQSAYYEKLANVTATALGDDFYTRSQAPSKMLAMAEPAQVLEMQQLLRELFGDRLYLALSKPTYLEMVNPAVNKGTALAFLAGRLGIDPSQVMAVGDSFNDLDMIGYAGWGVAVGNAPDAVKQKAQAVVADHDHDGVAEAFEQFVFS
ncbi:MAG: Cof-type HAD-IIB family hydrolase [Sporomusaceae bacterium]|nr:Cof-type HAD-IIB family hydrolase [Sporomusaceae bacterium]